MAVFENNTFVGQRIQIDGHQYVRNTFRNCILVYGGGPLHMTDNQLETVTWEFVDAAARTVRLLSSFYLAGGDSRRFVEQLLATFNRPEDRPSTSSSPSTSAS